MVSVRLRDRVRHRLGLWLIESLDYRTGINGCCTGGHQVPQHMMPPPAMYPGPGNPSSKMYPSGMMMQHPSGNVAMPPSSGMYAGQPYGCQPHPG